MRRSHKHLMAALALFALLGAQVFGLQRGYLCLCSGEAIETPAPSCEDDEDCCDHEHEGLPHGHTPVQVKHEAQGKVSSTPQVLQAPVLVAILDFAESLMASFEVRASAEMAMSRPPPGRDENPPASLLVAECMVLLI